MDILPISWHGVITTDNVIKLLDTDDDGILEDKYFRIVNIVLENIVKYYTLSKEKRII